MLYIIKKFWLYILALWGVIGLYFTCFSLEHFTLPYKSEVRMFRDSPLVPEDGVGEDLPEDKYTLTRQQEDAGWHILTQDGDFAVIRQGYDKPYRLFFRHKPIKTFPEDTYAGISRESDGFYTVSYYRSGDTDSDSHALYSADGRLIEPFGARYLLMIGNDEFMVERDGQRYYIDREGKKITELRPVIFEDKYGDAYNIAVVTILGAITCLIVYHAKRLVLSHFRRSPAVSGV